MISSTRPYAPWLGTITILAVLVASSGMYYAQFIYLPAVAHVERPPPTNRVFNMTAEQWQFKPDTIEVNLGDNVTIYFTAVFARDPSFSQHGFFIEGYNLQFVLEKGKVTTVNFVANKPGTFNFYCSIFCGTGHTDMRGHLIVH